MPCERGTTEEQVPRGGASFNRCSFHFGTYREPEHTRARRRLLTANCVASAWRQVTYRSRGGLYSLFIKLLLWECYIPA